MDSINKIGIIGAGGWGTALSLLLANKYFDVTLWSFETQVVEEINHKHSNSVYLPNVTLPESISATGQLCDIESSELIVISTPTQFIRTVLSGYADILKGKIIVNVAKGIEKDSLKRVSEILEELGIVEFSEYLVLTGPSHAEEVSRYMPTTVVAASENHTYSELVQKIFTNDYFRVYTSDDVIGCEIGGALKNVIAIASGIIDGLGYGDNTKAALITRGLAEISRLGIALGANPQTFSGLSGLGDLFVTCNSKHSRNRYVGEQIGKGIPTNEIFSSMKMIAEGVSTSQSAYMLGKKHSVELPICEHIYNIIFEGLTAKEAIKDLMTRQSKREWWW